MSQRTPPWAVPQQRTAPTTILIVEDDPVVAHLLSELVRDCGWRPLVAADAMQAVMFAVRGEPTALVLDIQMPGGNGVAVLQKLRANAKTAALPVVVLSGSADPALPAAVRELGAVAFVAKPLEPAAMRDLLQDVVARAASGDAAPGDARRG